MAKRDGMGGGPPTDRERRAHGQPQADISEHSQGQHRKRLQRGGRCRDATYLSSSMVSECLLLLLEKWAGVQVQETADGAQGLSRRRRHKEDGEQQGGMWRRRLLEGAALAPGEGNR